MKLLVYYMAINNALKPEDIKAQLDAKKKELQEELGKYQKILVIATPQYEGGTDHVDVLDLTIPMPTGGATGPTYHPVNPTWVVGGGGTGASGGGGITGTVTVDWPPKAAG